MAQLEKKLTSSSFAGACYLFSWAVRRCVWSTQEDFKADKRAGTEGLRSLIRRISQELAARSRTKDKHVPVRFPTDDFAFSATSLAQAEHVTDIHAYSQKMRRTDSDEEPWTASDSEICELVGLAEKLLDFTDAEDLKLQWLNQLLDRHPDDRFLLFTESLQTCEVLQAVLGTTCSVLVGSMGKAERREAVSKLANPKTKARVLVATSAADEGLDLQVASKVVHWDLSSNPATLMQRNGRAARLGQVRDVVAYYLILSGTHEERRDSVLQEKFVELGVDDEPLKARILGSLDADAERELEEAIANNQVGIVGDILKAAKSDNEAMDHKLSEIRTTLHHAQVLGRSDLEKRLAIWQELGLPDAATRDLSLQTEMVNWIRPVFAEATSLENTETPIWHIQHDDVSEDVVFDPEFLLFGPRETNRGCRLAGLPPWKQVETRHGRRVIVPYDRSDVLGRLLQRLARLPAADFLVVTRDCLAGTLPENIGSAVRWILFCTHPIREIENGLSQDPRPYLTYYAFPELQEGRTAHPLNPEGAEAGDVHHLLRTIEDHACANLGAVRDLVDVTPTHLDNARNAARALDAWIDSVTQFGAASFLEEPKYFAPIPVALVSLGE